MNIFVLGLFILCQKIKLFRLYQFNFPNGDHISAWEANEFPDESIKPPAVSNNIPAPALNYTNPKIQIKLDGSY